MANRRKQDNQGAWFYGVLAVMFILAYVAPILLFAAWVITELRARIGQSAALLPIGGLTPGDRIEQHRLWARISAEKREIASLGASGDREGVPRRQDGLFDERKTRGRQLNQAIIAARVRQNQAEVALTRIDEGLANLVGRVAQREAARLAVILWSACFLLLFLVKPHWSTNGKAIASSVLALVVGGLCLVIKTTSVEQRLGFRRS